MQQRGQVIDRSGTITTGGQPQVLAPRNPNRRWIYIQNQSSADLWIDFGVAAQTSQPSIKVAAGAEWRMERFVAIDAVSIVGATAGQAFAAKEG